MLKNKISVSLVAGSMALVGLIVGAAAIAGAQIAATTTNTPATATATVNSQNSAVNNVVDKPESPNDPVDTDTGAGAKTHGQAPLGGDGVVSSISGSTIVMGEEANEGGTSYTIDASAAGSLANIKVGDKIFVQGAVNGTNVVATSVSLGHGNWQGRKEVNDQDGNAGSEGKESTSTSDTSDN